MPGVWDGLVEQVMFCLRTCFFCCWPASTNAAEYRHGDSYANLLEPRSQRLLSAQHESAIEATTPPLPRLPISERTTLLKGQTGSSGERAAGHEGGHRRSPSDGSHAASKGGSTESEGGSPKAGKHAKSDSKLSLLDDDDMCPTCLEGYSHDNPKVVARCGHHYHLPCIYAWLERSKTCPVCSRKMEFEELM